MTAHPFENGGQVLPPTGNTKALAWFSCGVTSTVAIKIALSFYEEVRIFYFDTGQVHSDNKRFLKEAQEWFGQEIITLKSKKYDSPLDVIQKRRFINGPSGALCTFELKKKLRLDVQDTLENLDEWDQIFGFETSKREVNRAIRFAEQYPDTHPVFPLIEKGLTKANSLAALEMAGIESPAMYKLGYHNNNCLGCVKGGMGYWNKVRVDFPEIFEQTAAQERRLGRTCLRKKKEPLYLDELDPEAGRHSGEIMAQCGVICQVEFVDLESPRLPDFFTAEDLLEGLNPCPACCWKRTPEGCYRCGGTGKRKVEV